MAEREGFENPRYGYPHNAFRDRAPKLGLLQSAKVYIEAIGAWSLENRMIEVQITLVASPRNHRHLLQSGTLTRSPLEVWFQPKSGRA